jgi:hypothetical protein
MDYLPPAVLDCVGEATVVSFVFCAAFLVFRGSGSRKQTGWVIAGALALGVAAVSLDVAQASFRSKVAPYLHTSTPLRKLPPGWGKDLSPDQREQSIYLARAAFNDHGRLIEYMRGDGSLVTFAPTEADIRKREEVLLAVARFDAVNLALPTYPVRWLAMILTAVALGFLLGRSGLQKKNATAAANTEA